MAKDVKLSFGELVKVQKAFTSGRFQKVMKSRIALATGRAAAKVAKEVKAGIKTGVPPPNAPLTIALKKSSTALVDNADLRNSIIGKAITWDLGFVGVRREASTYNLAKMLHDGATIPVTDKMRGLFYILWVASVAHQEGKKLPDLTGRAADLFEKFKDWYPLDEETVAIKIPARPFVTGVFKKPHVKNIARDEWERALQGTIRDFAKGIKK